MNEQERRDLVKKYFEVAPKIPRDVTKGDILVGMVIEAARAVWEARRQGRVTGDIEVFNNLQDAIEAYDNTKAVETDDKALAAHLESLLQAEADKQGLQYNRLVTRVEGVDFITEIEPINASQSHVSRIYSIEGVRNNLWLSRYLENKAHHMIGYFVRNYDWKAEREI